MHIAEVAMGRKLNVHRKPGVRVIDCRFVSTLFKKLWSFKFIYLIWQCTEL